jgi:hypothetical protein
LKDSTTDAKREMLRHTLATLAYRGGKTVRGAPEGFGSFNACEGARTPLEILAHVGDLLYWALWMARGEYRWPEEATRAWEEEVARFFEGLAALDVFLASKEPLGNTPEKIFQGPIADALTHVGQIAMLRRMAGTPVRGENYFLAEITAGRVGDDQVAPRKEFD